MQILVDGVKTNYLDINPDQEKTIVILHGWGSSLTYWIPVSKLLSQNHRIILVDLPGFGLTSPIDDTPDIPEYTGFIRKFAQELKLEKFILAGHSFGGQIALDYALKFPQDLISIILIAPAAIWEDSRIIDLKVRVADKLKPLLADPSHVLMEQLLGWYTPDDYANSNEYQKKVLKKIVKYNLEPKLKNITVSTDIIWGNIDFVIPNTGDHLVKIIPNSKLHIIPGANHLINLTHPEKLSSIMNKILGS